MALRPVPWAIGNGAENSVELARADSFVGSSGATGIVDPADFKVVALPTPGAAVRVRKGTGVIRNTYPGTFGQSYVVQEQSNTDVAVAATGSSGASTKYVYVLITDSQYGGQVPPSVENGPYNDYAVTTTLPSNQPYLLLARINQPASTATITNAMITDLREVANPKEKIVNRSRPLNLTDVETLTQTNPIGERFPNSGGGQNIDVPEWATRAIIETEWLMVNERPGNAYGAIWVEYGPLNSGGQDRQYSTQRFRWNTQAGSDSARGIWKVSDDVYIPKDLRGTSQVFSMRGYLTATSGAGARPQMDQHSGIVFKVTFLQVADPSDT